MKLVRIASLHLFILSVTLGVMPPDAGAQVYKWVDKKGTVHFTDNPDELPEPQRSEALRKLEEKLKKKKEKRSAPQPPKRNNLPTERLPPDPGTSETTTPDRTAERRKKKKQWQSKVITARAKVDDLEKKCKEIEAQNQKSSRDSLIFARPGDRQKSAENSAALKKCRQSLKQAIHHLEVEIPEEARKQNLPPGWAR